MIVMKSFVLTNTQKQQPAMLARTEGGHFREHSKVCQGQRGARLMKQEPILQFLQKECSKKSHQVWDWHVSSLSTVPVTWSCP